MRAPCPECGCFYLDLAACPRCPATAGAAAVPVPAGFWRRGVALLVDYGLVLVARAALVASARAMLGSGAESSRVFGVATWAFPALFGFVYAVLSHWIWGQTLGKMALSVRVVMRDGGPLPLPVAVGRQCGFVLSIVVLGLGLALAALRADRRALHDLLAGTRVERASAGPADPRR
ncbi:MAG: RDD family protein [Candidatus Rokuibacteriota bacterium]